MMDTDLDDFTDLQHQAEQLTAEFESGTDLPRVSRNLSQILEAGQRLLSKVAPISQDSTDVKASILLGTKGYDVPKISQKLEGLTAAKTFEPLEPVRDTDIQSFLRNERENALLAVIEQTRKNTFEETERRHWECMENEWEREKQKILNSLRGLEKDTNLDFQPESESFMADPVSMHGRSNLDNVEMAYARQVYIYNEHIIEGSIRPSLVDMFLDVANKVDDKNVTSLWEMIKYMTDVPLVHTNNIKETRTDHRTQSAFVNQAKMYLEKMYSQYITTTIYGNLQQAELGGVPGTYNLVKSFLNVKPAHMKNLEDGRIDGHPVWAMIYYCLRCGDLQAAQQVVNKTASNLGDFQAFMNEYVNDEDHRLSAASETKMDLHYRRMVKNGSDPFKRAVYCVVGRCDPANDHADIMDKIDDYLWIKLCQIQTDHDQSRHESFTLQKLQTMLYEDFGESHFNGYQQPFLYFQVLILTAQFEAAIEFLSRIDRLLSHAVHAALVLFELKMLILPQSNQAQLLTKDQSDDGPMRRLNFVRLVTMYTRKFEATDAREALQYFYFLRDLRTYQGENLFMSCVSELVLETREFEMLLGKMEGNTRRSGAIDKFHGDTQKIIELVAKDTEGKGLFEDAVRLYDLGNKHDKVLELLNKLVTQVVSQASAPQSPRDRLRALAVAIAERYRNQGHEGTRANTSTFYLLLDLLTFFDCYHEGRIDEAFTVMKQLQLLPLTAEAVEQKVNSFRHYSDEVRRCLPDILIATMNILHSQYKNAKNSALHTPFTGRGNRNEDGGKGSFLNYLRSQARALITFAGMLPYRLPGDTNARLVQIEVLMN